MPQTQFRIVRILGPSLIVLGAIIVTAGSQMQLEASLTDQGSYAGMREQTELMWVDSQVVLPAAIESPNPMGVAAFGMLMMLIGFGLHAWVVSKNRNETPVPVRAKKRKEPRKSRRQMEVIWVERTIRL